MARTKERGEDLYGAQAASRDGLPLMGAPAHVCLVPPRAYISEEKDVCYDSSQLHCLTQQTAFTNETHSLAPLCKLSFI